MSSHRRDPSRASLPKPGDRCDRYRINDVLGWGGFGVVFRATHAALRGDVALKVLLPDAARQPALVQRFRREVEIVRSLRHPNTVKITDCSETEDGLPFFVMEYVRGETLESLLRREGPLPALRVARIAAQVLKSLVEAHALDVVHRDLKPGNVMLADIVGEHDFVKVLDFGIAKVLERSALEGSATGVRELIGTAHYMAPEQITRPAEVDGRSDLYSLGLVLAECLVGRPILQGESTYHILRRQASAEPLALPSEVRESALGAVLLRATQKHPDLRYQSALAMLQDIEEVQAARRPLAVNRVRSPALLHVGDIAPGPSAPIWSRATRRLSEPRVPSTVATETRRFLSRSALALVVCLAVTLGKADGHQPLRGEPEGTVLSDGLAKERSSHPEVAPGGERVRASEPLEVALRRARVRVERSGAGAALVLAAHDETATRGHDGRSAEASSEPVSPGARATSQRERRPARERSGGDERNRPGPRIPQLFVEGGR